VTKRAHGLLLFLVGGAILRASLTDLYLRYVRAGLRPYLIAAGVVLLVAAVATFWYDRRSTEDGHQHGEPWIAWLLVVPLAAILLIAPPALGSYAAARTGTGLQPPAPGGFEPLPAVDPVPLTVVDYAQRAAYGHGQSLGARRVELVGFITSGGLGHPPYLTRMTFSCCAADAQPIKVGLAGHLPGGMKANAWFEIVGSYQPKLIKDDINGGLIPFLDVDRATAIAPPRDPYEV
jgi:putative membrane protein